MLGLFDTLTSTAVAAAAGMLAAATSTSTSTAAAGHFGGIFGGKPNPVAVQPAPPSPNPPPMAMAIATPAPHPVTTTTTTSSSSSSSVKTATGMTEVAAGIFHINVPAAAAQAAEAAKAALLLTTTTTADAAATASTATGSAQGTAILDDLLKGLTTSPTLTLAAVPTSTLSDVWEWKHILGSNAKSKEQQAAAAAGAGQGQNLIDEVMPAMAHAALPQGLAALAAQGGSPSPTQSTSTSTGTKGGDGKQVLTKTVTTTASSSASSTSSTSPAQQTSAPLAEVAERNSSLALFLVLSLLIFSFWTSYYLKVKRITAVHETIVGLFAGMLVGAALRLGPGEGVQNMLSFSNTIMLNVLLPPIILASGYDLRQEAFFRNFGVILTFAFAGTFISAIVIGVLVYMYSLISFHTLPLTLVEALIFGCTLSATDPVTILAIFNTYKVDPQLYSVIFGESILNDAVSIVMFDVLSQFRGKAVSIASLFHGLGLFLFVFTFSLALGVAFGLACSLMLKHSRLSAYPPLETCLVALIAYTSYFFSNGVGLGGIVSLLFCGVTLKHYAYHNMSRRTQRATKYIFQTLANLSENFIFIYLGLSLFTQGALVYKPIFICVTLAAVVFSRYVSVFPIAGAVNAFKRARHRRWARRTGGGGTLRAGPMHNQDEELPREYQIMLFWAGLRGAVGFALSAGIEGDHAAALQTTVLVAVVLTVIVFGGTTAQMLEVLGIRTGVEDDEGDSDEEEEEEYGPLAVRRSQMRRRAYRGVAGAHGHGHGHSGKRSGESRPFVSSGGSSIGLEVAGPHGHGNGNGGGNGHYRDEVLSASGNARYARASGVLQPSSSSYDDSEVGSSSTTSSNEVLPGAHPLSAPLSSSSGGNARLVSTSSPLSSSPLPSSAKADLNLNVAEALVAETEDPRSVRAFLDRAGLIMRDGRWFSTLDQRYLTPLFTNSVASRKHEERKAARRLEVAAMTAAAAAETKRSAAEGSASASARETLFDAEEGYLGERDADTPFEAEEEEDSTRTGTARSAICSTTPSVAGMGGAMTSGSGSGSGMGMRRTPSRNGQRGGNGTAGLGGAFSP